MRVRTVAYLLVAVAIAVFVAINWSVFLTQTPIDFLFTRITGPLGFLILVIAVLIACIALIAHGFARLTWRQERRALAQELDRQRQRAEQADASRLKELRDFLAQETQSLREQLDRVLETLARK